MSDLEKMRYLTESERIALETFLAEYHEPRSEEFTTFELLLIDIKHGCDEYTTVAAPFLNMGYFELAEHIKILEERIRWRYKGKLKNE